MPTFLSDAKYSNVIVYCAGETCRNNIGGWDVKHVSVDAQLKGREFYTAKDKDMALRADYGFVLWDGKSPGAINNIFELIKHDKQAVVYFSPAKEFHTISHMSDAIDLLNKCDPAIIDSIRKKIKLPISFMETQNHAQGNLSLS